MVLHHIIQALFAILGIVTIIASLLDQDWFFQAKNAEPIVARLGRTKSRWLYGAIGLLFVATATYFYFHVQATVQS